MASSPRSRFEAWIIWLLCWIFCASVSGACFGYAAGSLLVGLCVAVGFALPLAALTELISYAAGESITGRLALLLDEDRQQRQALPPRRGW